MSDHHQELQRKLEAAEEYAAQLMHELIATRESELAVRRDLDHYRRAEIAALKEQMRS